MDREERRRHPRYPFVTQVTYLKGEVVQYYFSRDISLGGMFIETRDPFPEGTELMLEFELKEFGRRVRARAVVVRTEHPAPGDRTRKGGMGVVFTELSREHRSLLEAYLSREPGPG